MYISGISSVASALAVMLQDSTLNYPDNAGCCRSAGSVLLNFILHGINYKLIVIICIIILVLGWIQTKVLRAWREYTYRKLFERVRKSLNRAIKTVGGGGATGAATAYTQLQTDLQCILGPLADVMAGVSSRYPWIGDVIGILDSNAAERDLDITLLQVRHCKASSCDHLKTPFAHSVTISGTAASNPSHSISTIQQPGIAPIAGVGIPGTGGIGLAGTPIDISKPPQRRFPIVLGSTHAFVDITLADVDKTTRFICDCAKSEGPTDLKDLTGAVPPPPGVPPGPVLEHPFGSITKGEWRGVSKRKPNPGELGKFYAKKIAELNVSWTEDNVISFLHSLHDHMHKNR